MAALQPSARTLSFIPSLFYSLLCLTAFGLICLKYADCICNWFALEELHTASKTCRHWFPCLVSYFCFAICKNFSVLYLWFANNMKLLTFACSSIQTCRCFCHKNTIDMGYICSVCLSIFCEHHKKCSTCGWVIFSQLLNFYSYPAVFWMLEATAFLLFFLVFL